MDSRTRGVLERFALDHKLILQDEGEVGFGRLCVGFTKRECYVDYVRRDQSHGAIWNDERLRPPEGVVDAYHKHECMAVLSRSEDRSEALRQLIIWVKHYNELGVVVTEYSNENLDVLSIMMKGTHSYCFQVKADVEVNSATLLGSTAGR